MFPPYYLTLGQTMVEVKVPCRHHCSQCPVPCSRPQLTYASARDYWTLTGKSVSVSCGVTAPFSWVLLCFVCALQESVSPVLGRFCNQISLASKVKLSGGFQSLCQISRVGNLLWVLELFLTVGEFLWYNCSAIFGSSAWWLYGGVNGNLLQEGLCHRLCDPGSVQFSRSVVSDSLQPMDLQHSRLPCPSSTPEACPNSCPFSW